MSQVYRNAYIRSQRILLFSMLTLVIVLAIVALIQ